MFLIDFIFILIILAVILIPVSIIVLFIYGIVKKKYKISIVVSIITVIVLVLIFLFNFLFPTAFPYVDVWIYGKTKEEIINVYGEPYNKGYKRENSISYYLGKDKGVFNTGLMNSSDIYLYIIKFDENGKAYKIEYKVLV